MSETTNNSYVVYEVKNGTEERWVRFETMDAASEWIKNYNDNRQRPRAFIVKEE